MINLSKVDNSIRFTFSDSDHYLTGNGTIDVPVNSLSLIFDDSEMVTFKKSASNDIFVSAPIADFGMSKADLKDWYAENMVGSTGGGGVDPSDLSGLVATAVYVSSSSTIDFKNMDGDVISTINAEPFITDGMVDNVQISGSNLVITFNVDAGKQPISIPLTSIFDPSNYYDKSATDALLSGKVAVTDYNTYTAATDAALSGKQDTLLFYTEDDNTEDGFKQAKIETVIEDTENGVTKTAYVESLVNDYSPFAEIYASTEVNNSEESYQKSADVYVDSEDGLYLGYQTQDDNEQTYSEAKLEIGANGISLNVDNGVDIVQVDVTAEGVDIDGDAVVTESQLIDYATVASLSGKQDTLIAGSGITISGNVISADGGGGVDPSILDGKVDKNSIAPLEGISISGECPNEIDGTTGVTKITYSPFTEQYHSIRETDNGVEYAYDYPIMGKVDFYDENGELLHTIEGIENWDSVPYIERWGNEIVSGDTIVKSETYLSLDASPNGNAETQQGEISLGINSVGASSNISIRTNGEQTHRNGVEINAQDDVSGTSLKVTPSGVTINDEEVATVSMLDEKVDIIDYDEAQRVTAAALNDLNDRFGGLKLRKLTQVQYDALTVKDDNTLYIITNVVNNNA